MVEHYNATEIPNNHQTGISHYKQDHLFERFIVCLNFNLWTAINVTGSL